MSNPTEVRNWLVGIAAGAVDLKADNMGLASSALEYLNGEDVQPGDLAPASPTPPLTNKMDPTSFLRTIIDPTLDWMAKYTGIKKTDEARVLVMAIAGQESDWKHRRQIGIGQYNPQSVGARGYWQFESTWGGPVALNDVQQKASTQLGAVCSWLQIPTDELALYEAIAWNDTLACACARLLLWVDPSVLPALGQQDAAWSMYVRNWRPGAPHPEAWPQKYGTALSLVKQYPA